MPKAIISDTSCFIILTNIGELDLLRKTYEQVTTTSEVLSEYGEKLPGWVEIKSVTDKEFQKKLELQVDKGEASAIALAIEIPNSTVILDDYKARCVAEQLGLDITGTVGVLIKAKLLGVITSIKPYLNKIRETDFRISIEIERQALKEAGE